MGNKTCDLMKAGKTVLFAFEEAIGIVFACLLLEDQCRGYSIPSLRSHWVKKWWGTVGTFSIGISALSLLRCCGWFGNRKDIYCVIKIYSGYPQRFCCKRSRPAWSNSGKEDWLDNKWKTESDSTVLIVHFHNKYYLRTVIAPAVLVWNTVYCVCC